MKSVICPFFFLLSISSNRRLNIFFILISSLRAVYVAGIMFYKLGIEFFNGSITTLATDRFQTAHTFTKCT